MFVLRPPGVQGEPAAQEEEEEEDAASMYFSLNEMVDEICLLIQSSG